MVPSCHLLNPDRGASQTPHSHRAPWSAHQACCLEGLLQQGASSTDRHRLQTAKHGRFLHFDSYWSLFCCQRPGKLHLLCRSCHLQVPKLLAGEQPLPGMETGMCLAERLFLPFHLAHYFSTSHLFIPSPFLASLLSPYACTTNVYILPHLHICQSADAIELQSKLSATTKHQKEM